MSVISSDFHGNVKKLDKFLNYKPDVQHIFAGDAVDSWDEPYENQLEVLRRLVKSDCVLLYGNHELSYHPDYRISCSGKHMFGTEHFPQYLTKPERWCVAYNADGYLVTHAGISTKHAGRAKTVNGLVGKLKKQFRDKHPDIFDVGTCRGGLSSSGGILWYDFRYDWDKLASVNQVFGHCSLREPWEDKSNVCHHVCVNSDDRVDECWVFDTEIKEVVVL